MASGSMTAVMLSRRNVIDTTTVQPKPSLSLPSRHINQSNCVDTRMLVQNYSNFKRSGPPARVMFYQDGSWADFATEVVDSVRLPFEEGKAVVEVGIDGATHLVDLYRMLQICLESGSQRSIAWIDVNGKCFFPKTFVDGCGGEFGNLAARDPENQVVNSGIPKVEVEIRIGGKSDSSDSTLTKRRNECVEIEPEGSCSDDRPRGAKRPRVITTRDVESPRWPKAKLLREGEKAYTIVKNLFLSGLGFVEPGGATITSIHQWVRSGPLDRARYEVFQEHVAVTRAARGDPNMTFAWYGASAKGVATVLSHGFALPSKVPGSETHGVGVYLSPIRSPHLSAMLSEVDDNGEKHVILCRVILGKCEKVEAGSRQLYPSSVDFDTGVDDLVNPKWYVVWGANMNTRILPECVVSYTSSRFVPGQLRGLSFGKMELGLSFASFAKLILKLRTYLPPSRVQELQILFTGYKDGKLAEDAFVKQFRSVVGDDMLARVIREESGEESG